MIQGPIDGQGKWRPRVNNSFCSLLCPFKPFPPSLGHLNLFAALKSRGSQSWASWPQSCPGCPCSWDSYPPFSFRMQPYLSDTTQCLDAQTAHLKSSSFLVTLKALSPSGPSTSFHYNPFAYVRSTLMFSLKFGNKPSQLLLEGFSTCPFLCLRCSSLEHPMAPM